MTETFFDPDRLNDLLTDCALMATIVASILNKSSRKGATNTVCGSPTKHGSDSAVVERIIDTVRLLRQSLSMRFRRGLEQLARPPPSLI